MNYSEIKITINTNDIEIATAICQMVVPYGVYIEDYSDVETSAIFMAPELIDEELLKKDRSKGIIHIYIDEHQNPAEAIAFLQDRMEAENIWYNTETSTVNEEDYATSWKKYYHPMRIGQNLVVVPTWEEYDASDSDIILELDPGMAFGTGTHETTRLCMSLLEKYISKNDTVLDIGCGSGILSVTSVLLGAKNAVGCDIDPVAVKVSKENSKLNHVDDKCDFLLSDLTDGVNDRYNVVCANIVADIVISLSSKATEYMTENGIFICSGIIDTREQDVENALQNNNFTIIDKISDGGWVAFAAKQI